MKLIHPYILAIVLSAILFLNTVVIAQQHGGSTRITSASILHGVCGEISKGWLFVVGRAGNNGVVYNVTKLNESPQSPYISALPPGKWPSMAFYACNVIEEDTNYLLWLAGTYYSAPAGGGTEKGVIISVYRIPGTGGQPTLLGNKTVEPKAAGDKMSFRDLAVVRNQLESNKYHIYILSVQDSYVDALILNATITGNTVSFGEFTSIFEVTGDGYGITYNPVFNRFGVLLKNGTNLVLSVYEGLNTGKPLPLANVTIVAGFTGIRAAEAAYSKGCVIAASGNIYTYTESGVSVVLRNAFTGEAYALLVSEGDGRIGAYVYTLNGNNIGMVAVDLIKPGIGYQDAFATGTMSGYGDAFIVYADPSTKVVNPAGTGNPYMVYTAGDAIIYYDLTRGGSVPYPIPEPHIVLSIAVAIVAFIVLYKVASNFVE